MSERTQGALLVLGGAFLWGIIGFFTRSMAGFGFSAIEITAVRLVGAAVFMSAWFALRNRRMFCVRLRDLWMFFGTGILSFVFFNWCYFNCMERGTIAAAAVLLYTAPSFVMVLSAWLFRERLTGRKLLSLVLTTAGCVLVTGVTRSGGLSPAAILFGVGAGFGYALYSIFGRYALRRYPPAQVTLWTYIVGGAGSLVLIPVQSCAEKLAHPSVLLLALPLILCSTIAPLLLYTAGLSRLETGEASVIATVEPVVAAVVGTAAFREVFYPAQGIGILLVLAAIVLQNRRR